jgi:acetyltransferase-like isoleucine patch superfamily enzyme
VGANSVVTKDIPDYCVAVGTPARIVKRYSFEKKEWVKTNEEGEFII